MLQPWYVTGAARPPSAQYSGWQQADAIRARTAALRQQQQAPARGPSSGPRPQQQSTSRPQAQMSPGLWGGRSASNAVGSWWSKTWRGVRDAAGSTGPQDQVAEANARKEKQDKAYNTYAKERKERGGAILPWEVEGGVVSNNPDFEVIAPGGRARREAAEKEKEEKESSAASQIETYTDRAKARNALGYDREETFDELSLEEWNKLTPRQQAAVQFNADLFAAVEADRQLKDYAPSDEERSSYNDLLTERFGTTESSNPYGIEYAPNVAGLLQNANFIPSLDIGSIDDFIKMDVAISLEEVRRIDEQLQPTGRPDPSDPNPRPRFLGAADERLQRAQYLAKGQQKLGKTLAQGDALLSGMTGLANRSAAQTFGAELTMPTGQLDDLERQAAEMYKQGLAIPEADITEGIEMMRQDMAAQGFTPERQQVIVDSIIQETTQAASGQAQWYESNEQQQWLPPQDIAIALGAPRLGGG